MQIFVYFFRTTLLSISLKICKKVVIFLRMCIFFCNFAPQNCWVV